MKKFASVLLAVTIAAGTGTMLAGCVEQSSYVKVCEQKTTHERITDAQCNAASHPNLVWVYLLASRPAPAVGKKITGAVSHVDEEAPIEHAPVNGGVVEEPHVQAPVEHAPVEEPHIVEVPHIG